jgi:hypothetical protein
MLTRRTLALGSATIALLIAPAGALAAGTTVTVRVEGAKRTLLAPKTVHTHGGSITKLGAPRGACPATNAIGALDLATKGHWGGNYSAGLGDEVLSIFGERHTFSSPAYWNIWINNKPAQFGVCDLKLHRGDRLLFAPAPVKGNVSPTAIQAPRTATTSSPFRVRVVYYTAAGKPRPLARAQVNDGKKTAITTAAGYVTVHAKNAGTYHFTATEKGYIRSVPVTVKVS